MGNPEAEDSGAQARPDPARPDAGARAQDSQSSSVRPSGSGGRAGDDAGAEEAAVDEVERDLDELLEERDEYLDLAKRTKADFENYRKRMAEELKGAEVRGKASLAAELIGVIDNLERALAAAEVDPEGEGAGPLEQGILLTHRELREALGRAGVESYDPAGERFDPEWHEALQTRPADGAEPGTVVEVLQKGFRLDGQVIRAARVVVGE